MISLCAVAHLDYNMIATHSYDQFLQVVAALGSTMRRSPRPSDGWSSTWRR